MNWVILNCCVALSLNVCMFLLREDKNYKQMPHCNIKLRIIPQRRLLYFQVTFY